MNQPLRWYDTSALLEFCSLFKIYHKIYMTKLSLGQSRITLMTIYLIGVFNKPILCFQYILQTGKIAKDNFTNFQMCSQLHWGQLNGWLVMMAVKLSLTLGNVIAQIRLICIVKKKEVWPVIKITLRSHR